MVLFYLNSYLLQMFITKLVVDYSRFSTRTSLNCSANAVL